MVLRVTGVAQLEETTMATSAMTGKPLIESDRVEGTTVYDPQGNNIGSIKKLMIEKITGRVAYAVMSFGGFIGMGSEEHTIPWSKLPMIPASAAIEPTSRKASCVVRLRSRPIKTGTGVIAIENKNCTITSVRHTIGEYNHPGEERFFGGKLLAG